MNRRFLPTLSFLITCAILPLSLPFSVQADVLQQLAKDKQQADARNNAELEKPTQIDTLTIDKNIPRQAENKITQTIQFKLNSLSLRGNETLPEAELIAIAKPYTGKMITSNDLQIIAAKITQLYHQKGYQTSRCVVPEQQIKNGIVILQMEENKLNNIHIAGDNSYEYDKRLFLRHLDTLRGKIIHAPTLVKQLEKLNFLPSARITPQLQNAGFGKTDLVLQIKEINANSVLSINNNASRLTGDLRVNLSSLLVNPTGRGDYLQLGASLNPQQTQNFSSFSAKYVTPFGLSGGQFSASYAQLKYRLSDDISPQDILEIGGDMNVINLTTAYSLSATAQYGFGVELKSITNTARLHNLTVNSVVISNPDVCQGLGEIEERDDDLFNCIYDSPSVQQGALWRDKSETFFLAQAFYSNYYRYQLFDLSNFTRFNIKLAKSLEGVLNSTTQSEIDSAFALINSNQQTGTITGPVGNETLMAADFWKLYFDFTHYTKLSDNTNLILNHALEYSPEKALPSSYKYGGADSGIWGGSLDLALQYIWSERWKTTLGYHFESAVNYASDKDYTDAKIQRDDNGIAIEDPNDPTKNLMVEDGKVEHLSCGIKSVTINEFFSCDVRYPYFQINYGSAHHQLGLTVRSEPKGFESKKRSVSLSYAYQF